MKNVGMILEGGGQRGVFTSGVLDYLMEIDFHVPYVIGVSAGTCNAVDYVSWQPGRTRKSMIDSQKDYDLFSAKNIVHNGYYIDMNLIFFDFPNSIYPFDFDTYFNSETRCLITTTNCLTGEAMYLEEDKDQDRLMKAVCASSSLPFAAPIVMVDDIPMMDGGLADSIPIQKATKDGYKYNILILTRPKGYRKSEKRSKTALFSKVVYKKYPNLSKALDQRNRRYNKTMEVIEQLEEKGRVFVIRPQEAAVGRTEKNIQKLEDFYQYGYDTMKENEEALFNWLTKVSEV